MKLKMPLYRQPKKSMLCGLYAIKMLMEYYGKGTSIKEIRKTTGLYKTGTYVADQARFLKNHGFEVTMWLPDSSWFHPAMKKASAKKKLWHLKKLLKKTKKRRGQLEIKALIRWLEDGGRLKAEIVSLSDIKKSVRKGQPVLVAIDRKVLYGEKPGKSGHAVLVVGYEKGRIIVNDPSYQWGGVKAYPEKEFLYALYSWDAPVVFVKPIS